MTTPTNSHKAWTDCPVSIRLMGASIWLTGRRGSFNASRWVRTLLGS